MANNRTIPESKADLKEAATAITTFRTEFLIEPTEIESRDLPLFSVLSGNDTDEVQEITPYEGTYDVRYNFDVVMVFKADCLESEVITGRNAWITKLVELTKTAKTYPWRIEDMRHFIGHWGGILGLTKGIRTREAATHTQTSDCCGAGFDA